MMSADEPARSKRLSWGILWAGVVVAGLLGLCGWLVLRSRHAEAHAPAPVAAAKRPHPRGAAPARPRVSYLVALARLHAPPMDKMHVELCATNLKLIEVALHDYYVAHEHQYPTRLAELVPKYLSRVPVCRVAKRDTYSASYQVDNDAETYTVYCSGNWHRHAGLGKDFPRLTHPGGIAIR